MAKTLSYKNSKANNSKVWSLTWQGNDEQFSGVMAELALGFGVAANVPEYLLQNGFSQAMQDSIAGKKLAEGVESLEGYLNKKYQRLVDGEFATRGPRVDPVTRFAREAVSAKFPKLEGDAYSAKVAEFITKHRAKIEAELARRAEFDPFDDSDAEIVTPKKAKK